MMVVVMRREEKRREERDERDERGEELEVESRDEPFQRHQPLPLTNMATPKSKSKNHLPLLAWPDLHLEPSLC